MGRTIATVALCAVACLIGCGGSTESDSGKGGGGNAAGSGGAGGSGNAAGTGGTGNVGGGGSGGSGNAGGTSSFKECSVPGTCVLRAKNCCGYCTYTPITEYEAINAAHSTEYENLVCPEPQPCPDCITFEDANHLALCRAGQCTGVDLREDELSACQSDADCRLRWGTHCCESCGGTDSTLVAYNKSKSLEAEICDPAAGACPPCVPPEYPAGALAICSLGHCKVTIVGP